MDQINNFELIRLVKGILLLWNKSLPGYKNMRVKYRIWASIADVFSINHSEHESKGIQYIIKLYTCFNVSLLNQIGDAVLPTSFTFCLPSRSSSQ